MRYKFVMKQAFLPLAIGEFSPDAASQEECDRLILHIEQEINAKTNFRIYFEPHPDLHHPSRELNQGSKDA